MKQLARYFVIAVLLAAGLGMLRTAAAEGAVIIQYHRFGESLYPSTNVRISQFEAHLEELSKPKYIVLPLPEIIARINAKETLPDRTVGISIDDAFLSVYREAFPRLKKAGIPFTLFVATQPIERGVGGYMTWKQIRELRDSGVTIGTQTHTHLHMADESPEQNRNDLQISNKLFKMHLDEIPKMIAYPYGEYSLAVGELVHGMEFTVGFGQHSGTIHAGSDMLYLPRFSMNENYGGLGRFRLAVNALPLNIAELSPLDPLLSPTNNPPVLGFTVKGDAAKRLSQLACYTSSEGRVQIERLGPRIEVRLKKAFAPGRGRINCTMRTQSDRWRWYGLQFYVPKG